MAVRLIATLRNALVDELVRQAGGGRLTVQVPGDPKRADEVVVDDGVILMTPMVLALLRATRDSGLSDSNLVRVIKVALRP